METASLNLVWSDCLVAGLASAGVTQVVISPGSRSTPLVLAVNRHPQVHSWNHPDERCAAFFALGLASHERKPVALIATSGSAPAHWLPAVIEANRSGIPLILLSADRPPELQACGANQTVDQIHLFGNQVRAFHDAGTPDESKQALSHIRSLAIQATHQACWPDPGPVHINLPFREPLIPTTWPPVPDAELVVAAADHPLSPDTHQLERIRDRLNRGKGLIVCGSMLPDESFAVAVTELANQLGCPLLADPLSQLRFGEHDHSHIISRYDSFLRSNVFIHAKTPDWILRFGAAPASTTLLNYLAQAEAPTLLCAPRGDWPDPLHQVIEMARTQPALLCKALLQSELSRGSAEWLNRFTTAETTAEHIEFAHEEKPFEAVVIQELISTLPENITLFSGNSLPIRQLDLWSGQSKKNLRIHANRGASGIDGNLSTLFGLAAAGKHPVMGLIGDLTLFHDMNGLLMARGLDGIIVLLNNQGGGIFGTLPQAGLARFEEDWLTPIHLDFSHVAMLYGLEFHRIIQQCHFLPTLKKSFKTEGVTLIEVILEREISLKQQNRYINDVLSAVEA